MKIEQNNQTIIAVCSFLANHLNFFILTAAILEFFILILCILKLFPVKNKVRDLQKKKTQAAGMPYHNGKKLNKVNIVHVNMDYAEFEQVRNNYQKSESIYNVYTQIIQIFPLLGILGTVAGLYLAVSSGENLYHGVGFALSSTIYGLIATIFYKIIDIILETFIILPIEEGMENFEKDFGLDFEKSTPTIS